MPLLQICRGQIDISIRGDTGKLLEEMCGFHGTTGYGRYLRQTGYALKKLGVDWLTV